MFEVIFVLGMAVLMGITLFGPKDMRGPMWVAFISVFVIFGVLKFTGIM